MYSLPVTTERVKKRSSRENTYELFLGTAVNGVGEYGGDLFRDREAIGSIGESHIGFRFNAVADLPNRAIAH